MVEETVKGVKADVEVGERGVVGENDGGAKVGEGSESRNFGQNETTNSENGTMMMVMRDRWAIEGETVLIHCRVEDVGT